MQKVMIESPFRADTLSEHNENRHYAHLAVEDSLTRGEAPFASHLFYPYWLDDTDEAERRQGLCAGWSWLAVADRVAVYTDRGISSGMRAAINQALQLGIPVEKRTLKSEGEKG
jgi:hypothetical protein